MKIIEYQQGVQEYYNLRPWAFAITKDNYVIYRADMKIYGIAVSDEEYDAIVNVKSYIHEFCMSAVDKIWEILRQEYNDYIKFDYQGPSLCMVCYFSHGHFKHSERAVHYRRLLDRINGVESIDSWIMRHPHARFTEYQQMMAEFSDVFADDELINN